MISNLTTIVETRKQLFEQEQKLRTKMSKTKNKIAVTTGEGGIGKSTVTVNLRAPQRDREFPEKRTK